ncbi:ABC transporter substrate-binding protein [Parasphaerochaeta coccoides]|uniref:ABC transporter substrate binding protein n=1 Tax=Parasphaerochaeta coccoides (strain ATCC BAA-1237 / DSM 17374 / SPN1) TaxID=760011 RepID=F4GJF0_PARC1|nr:ABC transporter substrate-binding protein [Parasphaerochaeta coccoides]AEC02215.1 ABC transporter substrate binding protein [Parasphaerochaeta coccoides DSM 17374]
MKKTLKKAGGILLLAVGVCASLWAGGTSEAPSAGKKAGVTKIGVSKLLAHPALDAAEQGMVDYLKQTGLSVSFDSQNANGEIATASSIAQKFKNDRADIVVGIATPSAQALANVFTDIPVVFTAVTDPVAAGLVASATAGGGNVTGVSDANPIKEQLELFKRLTGARTIGMIYSSGEANAIVQMEEAQIAASELGMAFVPVAIANSAEVKLAAQSIIDRIDAVYIATDNTVVSAIASVSDVCMKAGKPLFNADTTSSDGIDFFLSWGFNYYSLGVATGKLVERIINGENPGSIPTVFLSDPSEFELWVNLDVAGKLGLTVPQDILDAAKVIVQDGRKITR